MQPMRHNLKWMFSRENPFFPLLPVLPLIGIGLMAANIVTLRRTHQKMAA